MLKVSQSLQKKAKAIRLLAMDVDGVLSDGQIIYDSKGEEIKSFYVQDGVGLKALSDAGIVLAIITGRCSMMVERRAKELGIKHIIQGRDDKYVALTTLADELGFSMVECAYMGDDLPDLKAIRQAGLGVSVPNGCQQVKEVADWVTERSGGYGAVREICELILQAQDKYDAFIEKFS